MARQERLKERSNREEKKTDRFDIPREELVVGLVHGCEVGHVRQEDIHFDDVLEGAARLVQNGGEVLQGLALRK